VRSAKRVVLVELLDEWEDETRRSWRRILARFGGGSGAEEWYQSVQGIGCEDGRTGEGGSEEGPGQETSGKTLLSQDALRINM